MLKAHNNSYIYNSRDAMASRMLAHSRLKFTHTLLFTVCLITEIQTSNVKVFNPEESSPCAAYFLTQDTRHSDLISKLLPGMTTGSLLLYLYLLLCVFSNFTYKVDVLMLRIPDGDLLLKHVRGFMFMDYLQFYTTFVHVLVYINDHKHNTKNE